MSTSETQKVLEFVAHLDNDENPYAATAHFLAEQLRIPPLPKWARYVKWSLGLPLMMILIQAVHLLVFRIKTNSFYLFSLNSLGLIKIDTANHCSILLGIYSVLCMLSIVLEEFELVGFNVHGFSDVISGTKPLILLVASWAYLWSFVCLLVSTRLRPVGGNPYTLPVFVSWILNGLFLGILLWPFGPVSWSFYMVSIEHTHIKNILGPIIKDLLKSATTYSKLAYTPVKMLTVLLPAQKAVARVAIISIHVRRGLTCYIISCGLLCLAYPPLLFFSFKTLFLPSHLDNSLKLQRTALPILQISGLTYLVSACNIPLLYWMLKYPGDSFVTDPKWWVGMELGLTIPFTIVANINLRVSYRAANRKPATNEPRDRHIHLGNLFSQSLSVSNDLKRLSFNSAEKV